MESSENKECDEVFFSIEKNIVIQQSTLIQSW